MTQKNINYQPKQATETIQYDKEILFKYHKLSAECLNPEIAEDEQTRLRLEQLQKESPISEIQFSYILYVNESTPNNRLIIYEYPSLSDEEDIKLCSLLYIMKQYLHNEYELFFIRKNNPYNLNLSDKEVNDTNDIDIKEAHSLLEKLINLLEIQKNQTEKTKITFNVNEKKDIGNNTKKDYIRKDLQVEITAPNIVRSLVEKVIVEIIEHLRLTKNLYINNLFFKTCDINNITDKYEYLKSEFDNLDKLTNYKGKQHSKKAQFKGYLSKLIHHYVQEESLTIGGKHLSSRMISLLTYDLLSKFGLISTTLINTHSDSNKRMRYIDDLPKWGGKAIFETKVSPFDYSKYSYFEPHSNSK